MTNNSPFPYPSIANLDDFFQYTPSIQDTALNTNNQLYIQNQTLPTNATPITKANSDDRYFVNTAMKRHAKSHIKAYETELIILAQYKHLVEQSLRKLEARERVIRSEIYYKSDIATRKEPNEDDVLARMLGGDK